MPSLLEIGVLITLFGMILGAYVYVHKCIAETNTRVKAVEDCVEGELKRLSETVAKLELNVTNRLTAVEVALRNRSNTHEGGLR